MGDSNANILDVMIKFDDYHIILETTLGTDSPQTTQLDRTIVTYGLDMNLSNNKKIQTFKTLFYAL